MNNFTGATRLNERDISNIKEMAYAGMDLHAIERITGLSYETVRRIARGTREKYIEKAKESYMKNKQNDEIEQDSMCEEIPVLDGFQEEMLTHVKNLNILLFSVEQKLERICLALGVGGEGGE